MYKVLIAHEHFLPDFRGGGETVVYETARNLIEHDVDVRVLTTGNPRIGTYRGIATRRLPIHPYLFNLAIPGFIRAARDVDLIHAFTYHAALPALAAGRLLGKPVICTVLSLFQDAWLQMRGPVVGRAFRRWERVLVSAPYDCTSFLSEFARDLGVRCGAKDSTSIVNSPGIALDGFKSAAEKDDVVLFVGKFDVRKGIHDVLSAASALPHVRFRLVGWGPEEAAIRNTRLPNVEVIVLPGGQSLNAGPAQDTLRSAYARARIFLFPSYAETLGLVLVEAMASGCAVVSSVPLEFAGIRVAAGDRRRLVEAIVTLWNDRASTSAMGDTNVRLSRRFSWPRYTERLLASYRDVLDGSSLESGMHREIREPGFLLDLPDLPVNSLPVNSDGGLKRAAGIGPTRPGTRWDTTRAAPPGELLQK